MAKRQVLSANFCFRRVDHSILPTCRNRFARFQEPMTDNTSCRHRHTVTIIFFVYLRNCRRAYHLYLTTVPNIAGCRRDVRMRHRKMSFSEVRKTQKDFEKACFLKGLSLKQNLIDCLSICHADLSRKRLRRLTQNLMETANAYTSFYLSMLSLSGSSHMKKGGGNCVLVVISTFDSVTSNYCR